MTCLMLYFYKKNLYRAGISLSGDSNPRKCLHVASVSILPEKFAQMPQICLSCPHRLSHEGILAQLHGLDLPRMLRTGVRLCFQS